MGELYECLLSQHPTLPRLKIGHWLESLIGAYAAGDQNQAQAEANFAALSGRAVTATMQLEIGDLLRTVTDIAVPALPSSPTPPAQPAAGSNVATVRVYAIAVSDYATAIRNAAQQASQRAEALTAREKQAARIVRGLRLAEARRKDQATFGAIGFDTPAALRTYFGVQTR